MLKDLEVLHEAQPVAEAGSCNTSTGRARKLTRTEHSAYHHEDLQGVRIKTKECSKTLGGAWFCLSNAKGFPGCMEVFHLWGSGPTTPNQGQESLRNLVCEGASAPRSPFLHQSNGL